MAEFKRHHPVRFSDTDYAGIMFYPRYFEALNATVEDWFAQVIGISFQAMMDDLGVSCPMVDIATEFVSPCRLGDQLASVLSVEHIGTSSLRLIIVTRGADGEERMRSQATHVCVKRDVSNAVAWPDAIRTAIHKFQSEN